MTVISSTFGLAAELYVRWFSDWLHIHFVIRTILLLLALWFVIFLCAKFFQYVLGPLVVLIFYRLFFRVWNFLAIETIQEIIYIRYYSKYKTNFESLYMRLCDASRRNRQILEYATYRGILHRGKVRRFALRAMVICWVAAALWVVAFGLYQEYTVPAIVIVDDENAEQNDNDSVETVTPYAIYSPGHIDPSTWLGDDVILTLSEEGQLGARLRDGPGIAEYTVIKILWDDDHLLYMQHFVPDADVLGLYWLRVQTACGVVGYISSQLVENID